MTVSGCGGATPAPETANSPTQAANSPTHAANSPTQAANSPTQAQRVRALLAAEGVTVILTRTTDTGTGPCVDRRAAMRAAGFADSNYLGSRALSPRNDLAGLNLARRPAVPVECGNMRNPAEAARMTTQPGRQRYAEAIARGILSYLER